MNQFTFESRQKTVFFVMMAIGIVCLGLTFFTGTDDYHSRFWSNILHNAVFFTGISLMAFFLYCAHHIGYSGWHIVFKRVWEAMFSFLTPGIIIMIVLGIGSMVGFHHLYHWADAHSLETDSILQGKSPFLNPMVYTISTVVIGGIWIFLAYKVRSLSIKEDTHGTMDFSIHKTMRKYAATALPVIGFGSAALIWLWVMSVDSHWYSTLFAWYCAASFVVCTVAVTLILLYYFKGQDSGYFEKVTDEHIHDLGKYLFAFSIFWTYLWFSQYMLIWYGNVGEETIYFHLRQTEYPVLFYGNLVINFALPFLILMRNDTKRKKGTIMLTSFIILVGHWIDFFLMIKPGVLHTLHEIAGHGADHGAEDAGHHGAEHASSFVAGYTLPGFLELGTMVGFLGLFLFLIFLSLGKAKLTPARDPYLEESLHHHV